MTARSLLLGTMLTAWLAMIGPAGAQQKLPPIPPLPDVPSFLQQYTSLDNYGWLKKEYDRLAGERATLKAEVQSQYDRCRSVEKNSADDADCLADGAKLVKEVEPHIKETEYYTAELNRVIRRCVVGEGSDKWRAALANCARGQPSVTSSACFKDTGIPEHTLDCLAATLLAAKAGAPPTAATVAAVCEGVTLTRDLWVAFWDAKIRCKDVENDCVTKALEAQKNTTKCFHD